LSLQNNIKAGKKQLFWNTKRPCCQRNKRTPSLRGLSPATPLQAPEDAQSLGKAGFPGPSSGVRGPGPGPSTPGPGCWSMAVGGSTLVCGVATGRICASPVSGEFAGMWQPVSVAANAAMPADRVTGPTNPCSCRLTTIASPPETAVAVANWLVFRLGAVSRDSLHSRHSRAPQPPAAVVCPTSEFSTRDRPFL
jgi:hypothetical protein